jgi:SAM-dependent methyltransferase
MHSLRICADPVHEEERDAVEQAGGEFWDTFYRKHENRFFKDRHWLLTEFAELKASGDADTTGGPGPSAAVDPEAVPEPYHTPRWLCSRRATRRVLEVGCGAGNTIFPLLDADADPDLFVYGCDFAPSAVDIVRSHALYDPNRCHAFVCDVSTEDIGLPPASLDVVVAIFVLSAINPDRLGATLQRLAALLKPGGLLLLRDYGRYDLAQLRFKRNRYLADNFYIRGDRTKVYFFSQEEIREQMQRVGLTELQNRFDNRLIVNRAKREKMFRVWLQCKYIKSP